ncbi:MAG TPA: helix-hairpin-helix domain-containing protein [bacterium]|nr:helix-hairpin-helix domain-containing protein [bacterium]HPJ72722.1 helix-hairpin-helix domain-containing protein [bacterium]HPQ66981.1 helix-hairpin-helix domain-containing protein [bacterium]
MKGRGPGRTFLVLVIAFTAAAAWAKVNINTATQAELESLPGIGKVKAERIIQYREKHSGFRRLEELMDVYGIGPKTFEALEPLCCLYDEIGTGARAEAGSPGSGQGPRSTEPLPGSMEVKCWKCGKVFEVPRAAREGTCPYCSAKFKVSR